MNSLHFLYPNNLWGLLLIAIPIIIHLYSFKHATKIYFSNVAILKEIKSKKKNISQLKKLLILLTRILLIAFIVIATAMPYLGNSIMYTKKGSVYFCIDNSYSMQAIYNNNTLLEKSKQDIKLLYNNVKEYSSVYTVINNKINRIETNGELNLLLSNITYSANNFNIDKLVSKINSHAKNNKFLNKKIFAFSDFKLTNKTSSKTKIDYVKYQVNNSENVSIDTAWIDKIMPDLNQFKLKYRLVNYGINNNSFHENIIYNNQSQQSVTRNLKGNSDSVFSIILKLNTLKSMSGEITIEDNNIAFDNHLYISTSLNKKIKVLNTSSNNQMLKLILDDAYVSIDNINKNIISLQKAEDYSFIIYEVVGKTSNTDIKLLSDFIKAKKGVMIYPSKNLSVTNYNYLLNKLKLGNAVEFVNKKSLISSINSSNIFYDNVFKKEPNNITPIKIDSYFKLKLTDFSSLLNLNNGNWFLKHKKGVYVFAGNISSEENNKNNTNENTDKNTINGFLASDISIPIIYKAVVENSSITSLYIIDKVDLFNQNLTLKKDNKTVDYANELAGNYKIYKNDDFVKNISININRDELKHKALEIVKTITYDDVKNENKVINLWRWCITFALLFVFIEVFILKLMKG